MFRSADKKRVMVLCLETEMPASEGANDDRDNLTVVAC